MSSQVNSTPCDYCRKAIGVISVEDGNVFLCLKCFESSKKQTSGSQSSSGRYRVFYETETGFKGNLVVNEFQAQRVSWFFYPARVLRVEKV